METSALTQTQIPTHPLQTLRLLIRLTKPGVTLLLVFTAIATAIAASGPWLDPISLFFLALTGGMAAGGAGAINHYLERDLDQKMPRTAGRPLPKGLLSNPQLALYWGLALAGTGLLISAAILPFETTFFTFLGIVVYVPVYTLFLKKRSVLNVVIGGAAGACPILAGWSTARVDWPILPIALALVVFFWTPAHFWAFAIRHRKDYEKGGFPMLPNVIGVRNTLPILFLHALFAVLASLVALKGLALILAGASGAVFLAYCLLLWTRTTENLALRVYKASNYYLMLVFIGVMFG